MNYRMLSYLNEYLDEEYMMNECMSRIPVRKECAAANDQFDQRHKRIVLPGLLSRNLN